MILFLDDDAARCRDFRSRVPGAAIVHTAAECIDRLRAVAFWDEVHLDHDLSGETYCDSDRDDCGMEVVRWVLLNRPDVLTFVVHTHNEIAGRTMARALAEAGYRTVRAPYRIERRLERPST